MPKFVDPHSRIVVPEGGEIYPTGVVELRVHGVNGGTPVQNLDDAHPIQISGDELAGFYRRRPDLNTGPERTVESFNWSSINTRKASRAWWLILFPFAAINFAGWLLPRNEGGAPTVIARAVVRLLALGLTVTTVLALTLIATDLLGYQCAVQSSCTDSFWLGWLGSLAESSFVSGGSTAVRMAILLSTVPAIAVLILWNLSSGASERYEAFDARRPLDEATDPIGMRVDDLRMNQIEFWRAPDVVSVLAWLHAAAAAYTLALVLAGAIQRLATSDVVRDLLAAFTIAAGVMLGLIVLLVAALGAMKQYPRWWLRRGSPPWWIVGVLAPPIGLLIATSWIGWITDTAAPIHTLTSQTPLPFLRGTLLVTALAMMGGLLLLGLFTDARAVLLGSVVIGVVLFLVLVNWEIDPTVAIALQVVISAAVLSAYSMWSLNPDSSHAHPELRHRLPFLFYFATGLVVVMGIGAWSGGGSAQWLWRIGVVAIPVVLLASLFTLQVRAGHDRPTTERMREGVAFVIAGLAVTSMFTVISGATLLVANRLGTPLPAPCDLELVGTACRTAYSNEADVQAGRTIAGTAQPLLVQVARQPSENFDLSSEQIDPIDPQVDNTVIFYPEELGWYSVAALAGFIVLIITVALRFGVLKYARWRNKWSDLQDEYLSESPKNARPPHTYTPDEAELKDFSKGAARLRLYANMTDDADWMVSSAVYTTVLLVGAIAVISLSGFTSGAELAGLINFSRTAMIFVMVGAFLLIRNARDSVGLRRSLGMLWDVMSFFPRRFHPLAPPCYAERTVPEIRNRLIALRQNRTRVLIVAHSEGTLITAAALMSLASPEENHDLLHEAPDPSHRLKLGSVKLYEGIRWVTYGCMLTRLYGRAWPNQLRTEDLSLLKKDLGDTKNSPKSAIGRSALFTFPDGPNPHWMNFGRYSDYLGGRVFTELQARPHRGNWCPERNGDERPDDVFFADPVRWWRYEGQWVAARKWTHSFEYENDTEDCRFRDHIWRTLNELNSGKAFRIPRCIHPKKLGGCTSDPAE